VAIGGLLPMITVAFIAGLTARLRLQKPTKLRVT
jgi:hypothetical protein